MYNWEDKNILVVEDEEINFVFLDEALSKTKVSIVWARNGREALNAVENTHFDLVLMDIKMPIMDGMEASRLIKNKYPQMPIIAQTAYAMSGEKERIMQEGPDDYITKPIRLRKLFELISKYLPASPAFTGT